MDNPQSAIRARPSALATEMVLTELIDIVGEEHVSTRASDKLVYATDWSWMPQMWLDRGMGTRDIIVIHSVIDILGINPISRIIFDNAAASMAGMVNNGLEVIGAGGKVETDGHKYVALTMLGNTTKAVMNIKDRLAEHG